MDGDIYPVALAQGTKTSAHHCHLFQRNDALPDCFRQEINSALRPSRSHSCHRGLITDFHLTLQVCRSMKNCIRCSQINTRSPSPPPHNPPTSPFYNYVLNLPPSITCPRSDSPAKGYMSRLNTPLGSSSPPSPGILIVLAVSVEQCDSPAPPPTFHLPASALQSSAMQIGSDRAIVKPIRQRKGVEQLGQDQWGSQDGSQRWNCATALVTFRSPKIPAQHFAGAPKNRFRSDAGSRQMRWSNVGQQ